MILSIFIVEESDIHNSVYSAVGTVAMTGLQCSTYVLAGIGG